MNDYKSTIRYSKKLIVIPVIIFSLELVLILLFFRKIRSLFPPPEIESAKIVGYSQYFGYPFYFDTIIFFTIIIFIPLLILFIRLLMKYLNK